MKIIKNKWTYIVGALIGAIAGYLYWRYVGCNNDTCLITSSSGICMFYGTLLGGTLGGALKQGNKKQQ